MAVSQDILDKLKETEKKYGLPEGLLYAQMMQESGGKTYDKYGNILRSKAGAQGIMQFMPDTAKQYGVDVANPMSSIEGAGKMMRDMLKQTGGNVSMAIGAYNWGIGNIKKFMEGHKSVMPLETQHYIKNILGKIGKVYDYIVGTTVKETKTKAVEQGDYIEIVIRFSKAQMDEIRSMYRGRYGKR